MSNPRPPKTVAEWVAYLHAARAVPQGHPDYADAQEAVRFALGRIRTLNAEANAQEQATTEGTGKQVGPAAGVGLGLLHGLSLGAGEPLAGAMAALVPGGQGFREGAQDYRQGLENIGLQQPTALPVGEMAGLAAQSLLPVAQGIQGGTATAAAIPAGRAGILSRLFTGAGQANVATPATMGGIAGFSAGGEDPGDLNARLQNAAVGAGTGAAAAAFLGGLGALRVPRWLSGVKRQIRQAVPKGTAPEVVEGMTDSAIRQQLGRQGYDAPTQERILRSWRAGKAEVPPVPPPPTIRPGETIQPIDPLDALPAYARAGNPRGLAIGPTPRGVGGHSYTGTYPAGTVDALPTRAMPSPAGGPPNTMALQQLQELSRMPQAQFDDVARHFPAALIQQLRAIRAQMVGGVLQ